MKLMRSVKFSFDNPRWWFASLIVLLASYVPILGQMVLIGYLSAVMEKFVVTGNDEYDDFSFERLGYYFKRGIYPFCVQLLISFCFVGVFLAILVIIGALVAVAVGGSDSSHDNTLIILVFAGVGIFFIFTMFFALLMNFVIVPATIAAALTQGFQHSFSPSFISGFIKRTWKEFLLVICFYFLVGLVIIPVVIIPGAVLVMYVFMGPLILMQWHIKWQLYQVYLAKGGEALPLKGKESCKQ